MMMKNRDLFDESIDKLLLECDKQKAESYKFCKQQGWDDLIDDNMLKSVSKGAYATINGSYDGVEEGYKPYYNYLKYGNQYQEEEPIMIEDNNNYDQKELTKMKSIDDILQILYTRQAKRYKEYKDNNMECNIDDELMFNTAKGAYVASNGTFDGIKEGYKPYYNYLKYDNQYEEVKEEPIMIEDNYNYQTPYSFEYEPYMIEFNNEVTYNEPIYQQQELVYEEPVVEEESCDINELISIVDILTNKISKVKKSIIHYISNYRPIINQYTDTIEAVLIE